MHIVLIHSEYWLNRQTARMLYLPWKWYRHGHHLTPSPLLSIALRYCVYCIRAGLLNNAVPNHCTYRISRAQTADQKYWENKSTEQTQKGKIERKTAKRIEATTSCMCQNKRSHTFGNETNVMRAIRESYYMCTFNNISIKLTLCCVFGAAWTMLFSPTYSVFFPLILLSSYNFFFSLPFVSLFWSSVTLFFLVFILFQLNTVHCLLLLLPAVLWLLSIGKRDIFIRFKFRLHFLFANSQPENGKLIWMCCFLTNQSDSQSVRICKYVSSKSSHHILCACLCVRVRVRVCAYWNRERMKEKIIQKQQRWTTKANTSHQSLWRKPKNKTGAKMKIKKNVCRKHKTK